MKIRYDTIPVMSIAEFADKHNLTMVVTERRTIHNDHMRYYAQFDRCEVNEGSCLFGMHGNGKTPDDAIADYASDISTKLLVVNALGINRREIEVPRLYHDAAVDNPSSGC